MAVSPEQYAEWKNHPVTLEMLDEIRNTASDGIGRLLSLNSTKTTSDEALKGFVNGLYLIANWVPELVSDEEANQDD